jgi:uncharacterized protein (TIGR00369 family)
MTTPDTPSRSDLSKEGVLAFAKTFPFFRLLGIEVLDVAPGWSKTRIAWRPELNQPAGILHGGVIASLVDTGIAHALLLSDAFQQALAQGGALVSVDLRIKYLRPVSSGSIVCETTVPRFGKRIIHASSSVRNDAGKDVATGDSIYMVVSGADLQAR